MPYHHENAVLTAAIPPCNHDHDKNANKVTLLDLEPLLAVLNEGWRHKLANWQAAFEGMQAENARLQAENTRLQHDFGNANGNSKAGPVAASSAKTSSLELALPEEIQAHNNNSRTTNNQMNNATSIAAQMITKQLQEQFHEQLAAKDAAIRQLQDMRARDLQDQQDAYTKLSREHFELLDAKDEVLEALQAADACIVSKDDQLAQLQSKLSALQKELQTKEEDINDKDATIALLQDNCQKLVASKTAAVTQLKSKCVEKLAKKNAAMLKLNADCQALLKVKDKVAATAVLLQQIHAEQTQQQQDKAGRNNNHKSTSIPMHVIQKRNTITGDFAE